MTIAQKINAGELQRPRHRSFRERVLKTLACEAGGPLLVTPLYALILGASTTESFRVALLRSGFGLQDADVFIQKRGLRYPKEDVVGDRKAA